MSALFSSFERRSGRRPDDARVRQALEHEVVFRGGDAAGRLDDPVEGDVATAIEHLDVVTRHVERGADLYERLRLQHRE